MDHAISSYGKWILWPNVNCNNAWHAHLVCITPKTRFTCHNPSGVVNAWQSNVFHKIILMLFFRLHLLCTFQNCEWIVYVTGIHFEIFRTCIYSLSHSFSRSWNTHTHTHMAEHWNNLIQQFKSMLKSVSFLFDPKSPIKSVLRASSSFNWPSIYAWLFSLSVDKVFIWNLPNENGLHSHYV